MNRDQFRQLVEEVYAEVLREEGAVLATSTQQILGKFPTLKRTMQNLLTAEFDTFVDDIQWVAPRPTTFKVLLKNGQMFHLKWTGAGFEAQIMGKRYFLEKVDSFQQALDKLNELLKYGPIKGGDEYEEGGDEGGAGGEPDYSGPGGGNFPGGEEPGAPGEEGLPEPPEGEATPGEEGGGEVEFEEPGEEPTDVEEPEKEK